ncbi:hypothetical protein B0H11DRAFT_1960180 [Mycena galericulata]|nr:hypothetical protein B0H11DRAFT_1960180 [Mycena galericulata]
MRVLASAGAGGAPSRRLSEISVVPLFASSRESWACRMRRALPMSKLADCRLWATYAVLIGPRLTRALSMPPMAPTFADLHAADATARRSRGAEAMARVWNMQIMETSAKRIRAIIKNKEGMKGIRKCRHFKWTPGREKGEWILCWSSLQFIRKFNEVIKSAGLISDDPSRAISSQKPAD